MARRRTFRSPTCGCEGGAHAVRKPLFRNSCVGDGDQLATTRRASCRLDKGDWPVLVTGCRKTDESEFNRSDPALLGPPGLVHLARFQALLTRSSPADCSFRLTSTHRQAGLERCVLHL